ncbi:MAG: response regulator, partial [Promethearchaeota archaeon]
MSSLILLIDDDQIILDSLSSLLKDYNYEVIETQSGKEALDILSTSEKLPDIIICDIKMPELDGFEIFKRISDNPKWNRIPFIFLSGLSSPDQVRGGKLLGVDDYLTKPIKEKDLISVVKGKVARYHKIQDFDEKINELYFDLEKEKILDESYITNNVIFLYFLWDEIKG